MLENERELKKKKPSNDFSLNMNIWDLEEKETNESNDDSGKFYQNHVSVKWMTDYLNNPQEFCSTFESNSNFISIRSKHPGIFKLVSKFRSHSCTSVLNESMFSTMTDILEDDQRHLFNFF